MENRRRGSPRIRRRPSGATPDAHAATTQAARHARHRVFLTGETANAKSNDQSTWAPFANRAAGFIEEYGTRCAEIDALPPSELRRRVEEAILGHVNKARWKKLQEVEAAEQETLNQYVEALAGEKLSLV